MILWPEFDLEAVKFAPYEGPSTDQEDWMSEGDRLLCTSMHPPAKEIQASQTTLQRLAEAYQKMVGSETKIPQHL